MLFKHALLLFMLLLFAVFTDVRASSSDKKFIRDGKEYGVTRGLFRGKWWNYFERGVSFLEGKFLEEAEHDFKKALRKRKKDNRRARTYGLHFTEYFPHRELGIAYYYQGQFNKAEVELNLSLKQEESARAKFYINKAHGEILKQEGADKEPPVVRLQSPAKGLLTSKLEIDVAGVVTDDSYVSEVAIDGKPVFIELAEKNIHFSSRVKLKPGENQILITATDLTGKTSFVKIPVTVDRQGPLLSIESIKQSGHDQFELRGRISDKNGVAQLKFSDKSIAIENKNEMPYTVVVNGAPGTKVIFEAVDIAGNTTRGDIELQAVSAELREEVAFANKILKPLFANAQNYTTVTDGLPYGGIISGMYDQLLLASAKAPDTTPPFVKLRKGIKESQTVFQPTFFLEGEAMDMGGIVSFTINDEPVILKPAVKFYFNYLAELKPGENQFKLIAKDRQGNVVEKIIIVLRKESVIHDTNSRLVTAILPFQESADPRDLTPVFGDSLVAALNEHARFRIAARGEVFKKIMQELKLSTSDLADKSTALKLGKVVSAEVVISGTIKETAASMQIFVQVIDTETTEVIITTDVYGEDKTISGFRYLVGGLAWKIVNQFPMIEGMVIKVKGNDVYFDAGSEKNVKKNMRFIIYRKAEIDPELADLITEDIMEPLLEVKVKKVFKKVAQAEIIRTLGESPAKVKDLVITK